MKRKLIATLTTLALTSAGLVAAAVPANAAPTDEMCGKFESRLLGKSYVQNNVWGTDQAQCIIPRENGFTVTRADGDSPPGAGGAPKSYPSRFVGSHYGLNTPGYTAYKASEIPGDLRTSADITRAPGRWNASYDIWFDASPTPATQATDTEIMIWVDTLNAPQPIGNRVATKNIDGRDYAVWQGRGAGPWDVVSYVDVTGTTKPNIRIKSFVDDSIARGATEPGSFMSSVQLGFEPSSLGKGLAVDNFSYGRSAAQPPAPPVKPTPPPVPAPQPQPQTPVTSTQSGQITGVAGLCLDGGTNAYAGKQVTIERCDASSSQKWTAKNGGLLNAQTGRYLDIAYASRSRGAKVQTWTPARGASQQQWKVESSGRIVNPASGLLLDVVGGASSPGSPVQTWTDNGAAHQRWALK